MSKTSDVAVRKIVARTVGVWIPLLAIGILALSNTGAAASPARTAPADATTKNDGASPNLIELARGWRIISADQVPGDDAGVSSPGFDVSHWYEVRHMPATVLEILQEDGVYRDLYYGTNLVTPADLWKKDWWYRTTFTAPAGLQVYSLIFKGINYRADIWLNGQKIADKSQAVGMYNSFEFDVSKVIQPGKENILAVKITPEQAIPKAVPGDPIRVEGPVELGDTWLDWLNWIYIGVHDPVTGLGFSFPPDRNAGVWKRVYLSATGAVSIRNPYVATDLPLPATNPASLTVYCDLTNHSAQPVSGTLTGEITRDGKPTIRFEQPVSLYRDEVKEVSFGPEAFPELRVQNPDLWWPYRWGAPNLYRLELRFRVKDAISDSQAIDFGIRKITQHRDDDTSFPAIGTGGNFYLQVNGKDYLIRGAAYTPDVLFKNDPQRDAAVMLYSKDLGLNLLRWELKIADDTMIDRADREGMPVMLGWMCCGQWELWNLWSAEDQWVARASLRARIRELRSHPSVVLWANGSDGLPPDPVLNDYHTILRELHWQNSVVDTVSHVNRTWSGIHMAGPYVWHPPSYWFGEKYGPARGSSAEEGDNEVIPPMESLKKFIPADKLWPINDTWYFHAGANEGNSTLENVKKVLDARYGPSSSAEDFSKKAQLAAYEDSRAKYESYATHWPNRKMTINWMLNNHWPSFFGHLFDYYFKQGGGYFGAKKGLQPVSVVWDYYATGDRSKAHLYVVNQHEPLNNVNVTVRFYNLDGVQKHIVEAKNLNVPANSSVEALTVPRVSGLSSVYFVRCQMTDETGRVLADNIYWESPSGDDVGPPSNDSQFQVKWAQLEDLSALNKMPAAQVTIAGTYEQVNGETLVHIKLSNNSQHVAFFLRAEITSDVNGGEVVPIRYDDNYITIFPHESRAIEAAVDSSLIPGNKLYVRVEGYDVSPQTVPFTEVRK
ncbi:MAG TPA: beta galactosidase jelly roll domain-containing protein [Candidatus Sulfotelmatobacter sp.]|nr:beta galactosidase jelly roll domain-containing protein [Candidatus Sulfotelmatobacter sp.]